MKRASLGLAVLALLLAGAVSEVRASIQFFHSSGTIVGGGDSAHFNRAEYSFGTITTSSLNITSTGSGMIDPGAHGPYGVLIDLWNGTTWTNVYASPIYSANTNLSAIFPTTINFAPTTATKLRLRGTSDMFWSFHYVNAGMRYQLNDAPAQAAVPEPATMTLWGLGALGCAAAAYRRRKRAA